MNTIRELLMRVPLIRDMLAGAWNEGAEAYADWLPNQSTPSGIPIDPPRNRFERY